MPKYKISVTDDCIGCEVCIAICAESFEMEGAKSRPKKAVVSKIGCIQEAADGCPVDAINIEEVK
jgi:ferredoxin